MASFKEGLAAFARGPERAGVSTPIVAAAKVGKVHPFRMHSLEPFAMKPEHHDDAQEQQDGLDEQLERRFKEGFEAGRETALRAIDREQQDTWRRLGRSFAQRVEQLHEEFETGLLARDQRVAEGLLDLALELTAKLVARHVATDRDHALAVVQECLALMPAPARGLRLMLNPDDAQGLLEVAPELRERDIEVIADASIEAGGCRLRNDQFEIDATLYTRWRRILACLGRVEPDTPTDPGGP